MRPRKLPREQLACYLLDVPHPRAPVLPDGTFPLEDPAAQSPLAWPEVFGNHHAVELEVGFGKGMFLAEQGMRRPDTNFLGVELERKYVLLTANRLARRKLNNVRLACTDARWFLRVKVPAASLAAVHVYFPDPWWKRKHHARRVFTPDFAAQIARALAPGGRLLFISDVKEYFDESLRMLATLMELQPAPAPAEWSDPNGVRTNFERKYHLEGRPIYRAAFARIEGPSLA